ncbi:MAG: caspase family protein [Sulfurimicrobium sp.]|nr:caspase family protein [Sulfurimicrobium sp.]
MIRSSFIARVWLGTLVACASLLAPIHATHAAPTPSRDPVLRIETGGHMSMITRISADAAGRWIVTASEDKTARLWDGRSGQALAVLRPPLGSGSIGAVYAAAISPDGRSVALGGNSDFGDKSGHLMHLFDRASASVPPKSTITGLEAPLTQLAWSPDSQLIAIGLRQEGLRVFRRNLQFVGADPEFNEAIFGVDFAADGRLAVASIDGSIRLYRIGRGGLERIARVAAPGGKPYGLAFSPDGKTLAVGYQDNARVDLLDTSNLNPSHRIDMGSGNLGRVAWSTDGSTLFAAGGYVRNGRFPVLSFGNKGTAAATEIGHFSNTIMSLVALPGGNVAAASAEPGWAVFTSGGQRLAGSQPQSADFRDSGANFRLNADASVVSFQFRAGDESQVFDLLAGNLKAAPAPDMVTPPLQSGAPYIDNWKNSTAPKANGHALVLKQGEVSRSLAINAADRSFVLGTEWFVRRYSQDGAPLWEHRVAAPAWAVNLSSDGRWIIAGLGDGSIRWFRAQDGAEQLALFAHTDQTRWIVWAPSGYYDTSVGGENLVGWHLNRAFNQSADFFSAGRFRAQYFRPDVVHKILQSGDMREALRAAGSEAASAAKLASAVSTSKPVTATPPPSAVQNILPPVVELQTSDQIETDATKVPVKFSLRSPNDAPPTEVKVRVDGKLVRTYDVRSLPKARGGETPAQELMVSVPPNRDAEIVILAKNKNGTSEPTIIHVKRASKAPGGEPVTKLKKLYLLAVGVSAYPNLPADSQLTYPAKDAKDFADMFQKHGDKLYEQIEIRIMANEQATRKNVQEGLQWLKAAVGPEDMGILFLAGHGFLHPATKKYFFASHDLVLKDLEKTAVPGADIQDLISNLRGRGIFFMDTCHSGFALDNLRVNTEMTGVLNEADDEKGVVVLSGAGGRQAALESDEWKNGAFTYAIKEGVIGGRADFEKDGRITPPLLHAFISKKMKEMTKGLVDRPPTPKLVGASFNEPFIVIK